MGQQVVVRHLSFRELIIVPKFYIPSSKLSLPTTARKVLSIGFERGSIGMPVTANSDDVCVILVNGHSQHQHVERQSSAEITMRQSKPKMSGREWEPRALSALLEPNLRFQESNKRVARVFHAHSGYRVFSRPAILLSNECWMSMIHASQGANERTWALVLRTKRLDRLFEISFLSLRLPGFPLVGNL
jgi:hypothetical protein